MADIHFSADLDSSKLEAAIKQSNQTIGTWAKGVEKAGTQADQGLGKVTKSFKEAISEQKALIKSIEQDVKNLQKVYDDATAGKAKSAAGGDLRSAKKALAEEQGTLLGLQKQQIAANEEENSGINKLVGGIGKWVMGLVTVGAALKVAKDIIASTEGSAHKFEVVVAEATAGVGYFFKSIASGDWSNFGTNLREAIKGAKDYTDAMEVIANKQNEQKIKSSELDKEIAALRDDTYNKDISNNSKRQESLTKIIDKEKIKFTAEAVLAKSIYETNLKKAATDSGLSEKQIENFIKEYSSLEKMIEKGEEFNKLQKLMFSPGMSNKFYDELQRQIDALGPGAKAAGEYAKQITKVVPETRKMLSGYVAAANEADAAFGTKNRRDEMQLAEVTNKIKDDAEAKAKAVLEIKNEIESLKAQSIDIGSKATDKGIKAELLLINNKYKEDLLKYKDNENAKTLLTERSAIERLNIFKKYNSELAKSADELDPGKGFSILNRAVNRELTPNAFGGTNKTVSGNDMNQLREQNDEVIAKNKKDHAAQAKDAKGDLKDELYLRNQIVRAAADLINQIGQQIGLDEKSMALLNAGLDAFTALATKGAAGIPEAAMAMVLGIIKQIPSAASRFEAQIEHINQLLVEQQRLIDQSEQKGGQAAARESELSSLEKKATLQKAEYERLQKSADAHLDLLGWRQDKADKANAAWKETTNLIEDSNAALTDFYTSTTASSVADAIVQGFQDGKTSAADFADTFNGFMMDAIDAALKDALLVDLRPWYEQFKIDMANGLTDEEKSALKAAYDAIIAKGKADRDALYGVAGIDPNKAISATANTGLSGIVRNMTEETGNELTGLFRRFADEQRVVKDYSIMGVNHLVGIEANTMNTVLELQKANIKLDTVITNTKQIPVGAL